MMDFFRFKYNNGKNTLNLLTFLLWMSAIRPIFLQSLVALIVCVNYSFSYKTTLRYSFCLSEMYEPHKVFVNKNVLKLKEKRVEPRIGNR